MITIGLIFGALFGMLSIVFGAFGAHLLQKKLTSEALQNFETGVKYQMYHALVLLIIGFHFHETTTLISWIVGAFIIGTILFSFSIYGLVLSSMIGKKIRILGPITPIGGLCLVLGWILLLVSFFME